MTLLTTSSPVRPTARWIIAPDVDAEVVRTLEREVGLPARICTLLATRGYALPEDAKRYLRPRLEHLHDSAQLTGIDAAVDRIGRAIDAGERVLVHGDYDVDGMCSTTILTRTLRALGANVIPFIPHRLRDGYDLTSAGVRAAGTWATLVSHVTVVRRIAAGCDSNTWDRPIICTTTCRRAAAAGHSATQSAGARLHVSG